MELEFPGERSITGGSDGTLCAPICDEDRLCSGNASIVVEKRSGGGDWGVLFFAYLIGRRVEIHVSVIYISMGKCVQKERYSGASKCHGTHFHILDCMSYELEHRSCAGRGNLDLQHGDSITRQRYLVNRP